ncbi:Uncharacterized membrane protein YjjP, DUF1212 family [Clostridium cavendishii DSM 21758]|uniref:Uncharacterized membrane protein YjjP, DUF1212 family n=1 Tax=Clostridium cavendishii DSM 21758 TaxID=1121302 RepID=A0A1M6A9I6_9CLOT|nr:threonine/serine exporter family protein [Clostridium cavendishii]SHI33099.1 Uncharacterized membrane protein YjjP, DUF1212 family [Clostridium cavendishii DSM 21758]
MDINKVLHVATFAGQVILENGGETYRVEETILRICEAYDVHFADSFVTPTGIMVSVCDEDHYTTTLVRRVKIRTVNLQKIHLVNDLSRNIISNGYSVDEFKAKLKEIEATERYNKTITILSAAIASACFSVLFGGSAKDFLCAFIVGFLIKIMSTKAGELNINDFFVNSLGGAIAAFLSLILVNLNIGSNVDKIIIGAIMLLVPGLAITNAIRDTIAGDLVSGLTRAAEAFLIAVSIAVGTGLVLSIWFSTYGGI